METCTWPSLTGRPLLVKTSLGQSSVWGRARRTESPWWDVKTIYTDLLWQFWLTNLQGYRAMKILSHCKRKLIRSSMRGLSTKFIFSWGVNHGIRHKSEKCCPSERWKKYVRPTSFALDRKPPLRALDLFPVHGFPRVRACVVWGWVSLWAICFLKRDSMLHRLNGSEMSVPHDFHLCKHIDEFLAKCWILFWNCKVFAPIGPWNFVQFVCIIVTSHFLVVAFGWLISNRNNSRVGIKFVALTLSRAPICQCGSQFSLAWMTHVKALYA